MNKIENVFKNGKAFLAFLTAGDPSLDATEKYILAMAQAGADLIEIGIPFSDPIAEGKVIERANIRALRSGTTIDQIFQMVHSVRKKIDIPLVFLTYLNPVFSYGYEDFFMKCSQVGIDGIIIPDLPFEEHGEIIPYAKKHEVSVISLIAPTSENRIMTIAKSAEGFIYLVSSMGVTGVRDSINTDLSAIISTIRFVTKTPVCVGFGISTVSQAQEISQIADGVIVGSAIVRIIEEFGENAEPALSDYVSKMKSGLFRL